MVYKQGQPEDHYSFLIPLNQHQPPAHSSTMPFVFRSPVAYQAPKYANCIDAIDGVGVFNYKTKTKNGRIVFRSPVNYIAPEFVFKTLPTEKEINMYLLKLVFNKKMNGILNLHPCLCGTLWHPETGRSVTADMCPSKIHRKLPPCATCEEEDGINGRSRTERWTCGNHFVRPFIQDIHFNVKHEKILGQQLWKGSCSCGHRWLVSPPYSSCPLRNGGDVVD